MPSSIAFILLPDISRTRRFLSTWNSIVEKIGFNESPSRLSPNLSSVSVSCLKEKNNIFIKNEKNREALVGKRVKSIKLQEIIKIFFKLWIFPSEEEETIDEEGEVVMN